MSFSNLKAIVSNRIRLSGSSGLCLDITSFYGLLYLVNSKQEIHLSLSPQKICAPYVHNKRSPMIIFFSVLYRPHYYGAGLGVGFRSIGLCLRLIAPLKVSIVEVTAYNKE